MMAQFRFSETAQITEERQKAIESLIPGSLNYYHLYFLDLLKRKKFADFSEAEKNDYNKFFTQHHTTSLFNEVEAQMLLEEGEKIDLTDVEYSVNYY